MPNDETNAPDAAAVDPPESPQSSQVLLWRRIACVLVGLQAVGLAVVALSALVLLLTGGAQVPRNEALLGIFLALGAFGLGFVARELLHGNARVRTPGVLWQVLVLMLVPAMWSGGSKPLAAAVAVVAVVSAVAIVLATRGSARRPARG